MTQMFIVYIQGETTVHELSTTAWGKIAGINSIIVNEIVGAKDVEIISHQTQVSN